MKLDTKPLHAITPQIKKYLEDILSLGETNKMCFDLLHKQGFPKEMWPTGE